MEFQTAFMGELLNINAFNQEGVELGKKLTFGLMGRAGYEPYRTQCAADERNAPPHGRVPGFRKPYGLSPRGARPSRH